jgi:outer membrane protein TolC
MGMEAEQRNLKRELLMFMGFAAATDEWSVTPIHELNDELASTPGEAELIAAAQTQRLDLQAVGWELAASEHRIELMRREGWPEMALGLSFERAPAPPSQNPSFASGRNAAHILDRYRSRRSHVAVFPSA